jgi:hypothetical protein
VAKTVQQMTITEALAEIKTTGKRVETKRDNTLKYLARESRVKDPMEQEGGSTTFIRQERQGIADLEQRIVDIRTAIQEVNLTTKLSLNGVSRSISEWLTWRREVAQGQKAYVNKMISGVNGIRQQVIKEGRKFTDKESDLSLPTDVIVHVNEKALLEEAEKLEQTLGELDGKLSLLNATTTIKL